MNFLDIVFASMLANNLLLFHGLGLREFLAEKPAQDLVFRALGMTVLVTAAACLFWVPDRLILVPFHLEALRTLLLFVVLGATVLAWWAARPWAAPQGPEAKELLVHSFLVGAILWAGTAQAGLAETAAAAVAVALGYAGALVLLRAVARRLAQDRLPPALQGLPLELLTLGLVWLVLRGLGFAFQGAA